MIQEFLAVFVDSIPENLATLVVGWEDVVISTDSFHHLLCDDVDAGLILSGTSMSNPNDSLLAFVQGPKDRELIASRFVVMRKR